MDTLTEVGMAFGVVIVWTVIVTLVLRAFGLSISSRIWSRNKDIPKRDGLRDQGKVFFVFIRGVVLWGWGVFLSITAWNYVAFRFFHEATRELNVTHLIIKFILLSAGGVWFGLTMWNHGQPNISRESAPPHSA